MSDLILVLAVLALVFALVAVVVAERALWWAKRSEKRSVEVANGAAANAFASQPTREERVARARGCIAACAGAEMALAEHKNELPAAMALTVHRERAAHAREELRLLGIEL